MINLLILKPKTLTLNSTKKYIQFIYLNKYSFIDTYLNATQTGF